MRQHAQVSVLALVCGTTLMLGSLFGIYCQGPFWVSGVVAAMNANENALALGLPAGVSLVGAILLSYLFLACPSTVAPPNLEPINYELRTPLRRGMALSVAFRM